MTEFYSFMILPKKTLTFGPITGSDIFSKRMDFKNQFRNFFFSYF